MINRREIVDVLHYWGQLFKTNDLLRDDDINTPGKSGTVDYHPHISAANHQKLVTDYDWDKWNRRVKLGKSMTALPDLSEFAKNDFLDPTVLLREWFHMDGTDFLQYEIFFNKPVILSDDFCKRTAEAIYATAKKTVNNGDFFIKIQSRAWLPDNSFAKVYDIKYINAKDRDKVYNTAEWQERNLNRD